ncbi:hypothetical protein N7466_011354 [Penicillium verhagenii]|uniref:uncharacterized protein n=1 Tax=Penicillium verhagenii TaxID=1562060 RepID=UPI0025458AEC|nr:uncharacterized protein N7466_011354 [Penicillium verhagenii]KAJ5915421.1 hypothetical protein N7466_011354 [Penicillium verhagenii]
MEEVIDLKAEASDPQIVQKILEEEVSSWLEDLEEGDLYSKKHSRRKEIETEEQRDALDATTRGIWNSLKLLCSQTDIQALELHYFDTKQKQDALKLAIEDELVTETFLCTLIRQKWPLCLDAKRKKIKRQQRSKKEPSEPQ